MVQNKKTLKAPPLIRGWFAMRWTRCLLLMMLCLLAFSPQAMAGGWNKVYQNPNSVITPDNPFASYIVHIYNNNGKDSYLDSDLEVWMDGVKIGQFDVDWDDEGTLQKRINSGNTYQLFNNYYGWKGVAIPWKNDGNNYSVTIYLSHQDHTVGDKHTIYFRGKWVSDRGSGSWQNTSTYTISVGTNDAGWSTTTPNGRLFLDAENQVHYECTNFPAIPKDWRIGIHYGTKYGTYYFLKDLNSNVRTTSGQTVTFSHNKKRNETGDYYLQNVIFRESVLYPEKALTFGPIYIWVRPTTPLACKGFATPKNLTGDYDQWSKTMKLNWGAVDNSLDTDGKWMILRQKSTDAKSTIIDAKVAYENREYTVNIPDYDATYNYHVSFYPNQRAKDWDDVVPDLYTSITNRTSSRTFSFSNMNAKGAENSIKLDWTVPDFLGSDTYKFVFERSTRAKKSESQVWQQVGEMTVTNKSQKDFTWTDEGNVVKFGEACATYDYRITVNAMGTTFTSGTTSSSLSGDFGAHNLTASRGTHANVVKLQWEATQMGSSPISYTLQRRVKGDEDKNAWTNIYTTSGTVALYSYDDATALPGEYYEYRVVSSMKCTTGNDDMSNESNITDGFSVAFGVISGRVTYGTGVGVDDVKVILENGSDTEAKDLMHSLKFNAVENNNVTYNTTVEEMQNLMGGKSWSAQMFVNPDYQNLSDGPVDLWTVPSTVALRLMKQKSNKVRAYAYIKNGEGWLDTQSSAYVDINAGEWTNLTLAVDADSSKVTLTAVKADSTIVRKSVTYAKGGMPKESVKGSSVIVSNGGYIGYVDEIRFFSGTALTVRDIQKNCNHRLAGTEPGLAIYWPLDEGLPGQNVAYDYSKTGGAANGRHGDISGATVSDAHPSEDQFAICGVTDENGNYTISGIPFSGDGISYVVRPMKGVHEFQAPQKNLFVSGSSLIHSDVDFSDISSFKVTGSVFYQNTNIPLQGANFYVDGVICSINGEPVVSDENGEFTISVPIGEHYINVVKNGHTFANGGRYPADPHNTGTTVAFTKDRSNLSFYDTTLVPIAGRIVGGDVEYEKPLGFNQSKNNIGTAKITLAIEGKSLAKKVLQTETTFSIVDTTNIAVESPSAYVKSTTVRTACKNDQDLTGEIEITCDKNSGEFAALLPPLEYKITKIEIPSNTKLVLPEYIDKIDATDVNNVMTDSISDDGGLNEKFSYNAKFALKYVADPTFKVVDKTNSEEGLFGVSYLRQSVGGEAVNVPMLKDGAYVYDYPIYQQYGTYKFNVQVYEEYFNNEKTPVEVDRVPLEGTEIFVSNALGEKVQVIADPLGVVDENGEAYKAGDAYLIGEESIVLDEEGKADYVWTAGLPNITAPFARGISMHYEKDGIPYHWKNDGVETPDTEYGIQGVIIGDLPTGTNILTNGPDRVLYVLRDPPGTGSSATWSVGSSTSMEESHTAVVKNNDEVNSDISVGAKTTTIQGTIGGMTVFAGQVLEADNMQHVKINTTVETSVESGTKKSTTVTSTSEVSTSGEFDFVGAPGDVFIGASTNISYGKANRVDVRKNTETGEWELGLAQQTTLGSEFDTEFTYEQNYIEGTLIPEFINQRNELFNNNITVKNQAAALKYVNNTKDPIYLTWLSKSDERYGSSNTDEEVWGKKDAEAAKGKFYGKSYVCVLPKERDANCVYQDRVQYLNEQIKNWTKILADNEKAKVDAKEDRRKYLEKNFSFSAGASRTETYEKETSSGWTCETSFETTIVAGSETDVETTFGGVNIEYNIGVTAGTNNNVEGSETTTTTVAYTLQEDGDDDMLSVDVYRAPDNFGPIFVTRGGQTCAPYEGATYTQYYKPGTQLNEATMQIEKPALYVGNNEKSQLISGVAIGKKASFTFHCKNESEIGEDCYFYLMPIQETITGGPYFLTSTGDLGTQLSVFVPAGETTDVVVTLEQTDQSVLNFDNIGFRLASTSQFDPTGVHEVIDDTVYVSAHFVPGSTDVSLKLANNVMNIGSGTDLKLTVRDYDVNWKNLKAIRIQYRGERDTEWSNAKIYVPASKVEEGVTEAIPTDGIIDFTFDMSNITLYPDQTYQFRAQSATAMGATSEVTYESEVLTLIKDVTAPQVFGTPRPTNGVLAAGDEISVTYNENIRNNILTKVDNFAITAILNEAEIKHDVALKMENTAKAAAATEADYNLAHKSFTTDMWVNVKSKGTIFSHGNGENKLTLGVDAKGHLVVNIGEKTYTSSATMPMGDGKWNFLAFSYDYAEGASKINAMVAYDATTTTLFGNKAVVDYDGNGRIAVGENITGALQELTLWDKARTMTECQAAMHTTKKPSTEGLIGYWKFNEGRDTGAADLSRNRSMVLSKGNWYLNNTNYAVALDGKSYVNLNTSACPVSKTEDYAFEMWFKGAAKDNKSKTLFSVGSETLAAGFNASGLLQLTSGDYTMQLGKGNYLDNAWHHFALNVLRNGSATVYVDGEAVGQTSATNVRSLADAYVTLGAKRYSEDGMTKFNGNFKGSIDEVRIWNATLSAASIRDASAQRLSGKEAGLVAYYPFEYAHLDEANQIVTDLTFGDRIVADIYKTVAATAAEVSGSAVKAADAPALKPNITETNLQYSFVANERSIIINLNEDADLIDGTTVHIEVKGVSDENGNVAKPIRWTAYVKQNVLYWDEDEIKLAMVQNGVKNHEGTQYTATILNKGGSKEYWSLSNLPSWLSASTTSGTIPALGKADVTFSVSNAAQTGKYEEVIYLIDGNGIKMPLTLNLSVTGIKPEWSVNPNDYDNYMTMVGVVKVNGKLSDDDNDIVAAFVDGECRGIATPIYEKDYDTYYLNMRVYGNSAESGMKDAIFKVYDASQDKVYASVTVDDAPSVLFDANANYGSYKTPTVWATDTKIEQNQTLYAGWNWISLYVAPTDASTGKVMETVTERADFIKSRKESASTVDGDWVGTLDQMGYGEFYKVQMNAQDTLIVIGEEVMANAPESAVVINNGWNWIGVNASYSIPVGTAFGGLSPVDGDIVKGQYGFATYDVNKWRGTLTALTPGQGYYYNSNNTSSASFNYPSKAAAQTSAAGAKLLSVELDLGNEDETDSYYAFDGASYTAYPGNMSVIGKVVDRAGEATADAEVAIVDAEGNIREVQKADADGIVFLTIPGDAAGDKLYVKAYSGGTEIEAQPLSYVDNAVVGTMKAPFIIGDAEATSAALAGVDAERTTTAIYDASGKMVSDFGQGMYLVVEKVDGVGTFVRTVVRK